MKAESERIQNQYEILNSCSVIEFVKVLNGMQDEFDKDFNIINSNINIIDILKKRKDENFLEELIIELLYSIEMVGNYKYDLIHNIISDSELSLNYDYWTNWGYDCYSRVDLKSALALSGDKTIIKDLLSKEENIRRGYSNSLNYVRLYNLYIIIGEYEKALGQFIETYNIKSDFCDEDNDFDRFGYAPVGFGYEDSLIKFIMGICKLFTNEGNDYKRKKGMLIQVLSSDKIKYVNLEKLVPILKENLYYEDFKLLLNEIIEKNRNGQLGFVNVLDYDGFFCPNKVQKIDNTEVLNYLSNLGIYENNRLCLRRKI